MTAPTRRGTTNRNARGSVYDRAARRAYLLATYGDGETCPCYRCGVPLDDATITVDRIIPGRDGGTYRRDNIQPACAPCNSETGGALANGDRLRPPFPYFGGKQTLGPRIAAVLPEHRHYVEPFGGSLAVLLAKTPSAMETVNDLDGDVMLFWRILRERPDELIRACAMTPHSRVEYEASFDRADRDDLERARRVWVCLTQGRGATLRRSGWRHYVKPAGGTGFPAYLAGYVERMAPLIERLQHVTLECRPALDIVRRYGTQPEVLLYVDPPYLSASRSWPGDPRTGTQRYQHEMLREDDHAELIAALLGCRAAVVLSGYPSAAYDEWLDDWHRVEFATGTGQSARGEWSQRTEVLWSNRPLAAIEVAS